MPTKRLWRWASVGTLLATALAVGVPLYFAMTSSRSVSAADIVEPGLDFSISSTSAGNDCNSNGAPTATCTFLPNATFTVSFNLITLGPYLTTHRWVAYSMLLSFQGVSVPGCPTVGSTCTVAQGFWPDCSYAGTSLLSPQLFTAQCATGNTQNPSIYTGLLLQFDAQCGAGGTQGTLTLLPFGGYQNAYNTALLDNIDPNANHEEASSESLTINCLAPTNTPAPTITPTPTATHTPGGPTDTPSPTATATTTPTPTLTNTPPIATTPTDTPPLASATPSPARTPTATPVALLPGDVNGDRRVDTLDALWVLWLDAGMVSAVGHPENADLNHDGRIDARDAAVILQIEAGLL
jgi:hypothetical protein